MRFASILVIVVAALAGACHTVLDHRPSSQDAAVVADARAEGRAADAARDAPAPDVPVAPQDGPIAPLDLPSPTPDLTPPDTLAPDARPGFSKATCKSLWTGNPVWQLSAAGGAAAGRPAIVTVDNDQYVVYGEGGAVMLHRVTPFADLGRRTIGGSAPPTLTPTVAVTRGPGQELGVAWEMPLEVGKACPSSLVFARFDVPYTTTALPSASNLTSASCTQHGYSNPSLLHTGSQYGLATVASYACSPTHYKPLYHSFTPPTVMAGGCYNGNPDGYAAVLHALTPSRFAVAHLWRASTSTPLMITLARNSGSSFVAWEGISAPSSGSNILPVGTALPTGMALTENRPALASLSDPSNDTLHLAWMASNEKLFTHACAWPKAGNPAACAGPATAYVPAAGSIAKHRHPALAASEAHGGVLLMAYATDAPAIAIVKLREGPATTPSAEVTITRPATPRFTALASHPDGFGLTWTEPVGGVDEVFYTFVGCY
jgi:hypothetical protein